MFVDIRRGLVFFDPSDHVLGRPALARYEPRTGRLDPVAGARPDDVVEAVSDDGRTLALRSADWLVVRGANRSRLTFAPAGGAAVETARFLSHWAVLAPGGDRALVGVLNGKGRPVVVDTATGLAVATMARGVDARAGETDPGDGRLWAPDPRARNAVLVVDPATGTVENRAWPAGGTVQRLRFARDGGSVFAVGADGTLSRHAPDGAVAWTLDVRGIGRVGAGNLFLHTGGEHVLLSLPESKNSAWGEDLVVDAARGRIVSARPRDRGPPARLAADWFGDAALTHAGETVDFFTGKITGHLFPQGPA